MKARTLILWMARTISAAVAAGAVLGSSTHLYAMAQQDGLVAPWAPPLGLDAVAIVAAATRRVVPSSTFARVAMAVTVGLSTFLQGADTWAHRPGDYTAVILTIVPPLAAWAVFELFMVAVNAEAVPAKRAVPAVKKKAAPAPSPRNPKPAPDARPALAAVTTDDQLLVLAREIAAEHGVDPAKLSRPRFLAGLRAQGKGVGTKRADELLAQLKEKESA